MVLQNPLALGSRKEEIQDVGNVHAFAADARVPARFTSSTLIELVVNATCFLFRLNVQEWKALGESTAAEKG
jgi:hypothetical protein